MHKAINTMAKRVIDMHSTLAMVARRVPQTEGTFR